MDQSLKVGQIFDDKFELQAILGAGGIGTVYKAKQLDCDRTVALKLLHSHIAEDAEYQARFLREAKALSRLQHPNIVTVYHLGLSFSGAPYLAMELIRGRSIRKMISDQGRLPTKLALTITRDVALALAYVHKEGIIHRDLKPDNIIIVDEPNPNTVKIIDFGLIHFTDKDQKLTATNALVGTVEYMSPEQCAGREITLHSDVYSLTVCLYEMLTGQKPFTADTPIGLMYKQINTPPPLIGSETVEMYHPILQELINTGLNKDPLKRFENMEAFAAQIDECISIVQEGKYKKQTKIPIALIAMCIFAVSGLVSIPVFMQAKQEKKKDTTATRHVIKQSLSQEIETIRAQLKDADDWLQKSFLYHKAYRLLSNESAASRVTRSTRLNLLRSYAESLDNNHLPSQALAIRNKILAEVKAKGLPGDISSEPFGNDQVAETVRDNVKVLLDRNQKKEAEELLQTTLRTPPRHFLPALESAILLHDRKLIGQFLDQIDLLSEALFAATLLRQQNEIPLMQRALEIGRALNAADEPNADSRKTTAQMFAIQDAYYWLMKGNNRKAIEIVKKTDLTTLERISPEKRRRLFSNAIILLVLSRDFEGSKAYMQAMKPDDLPDWNTPKFEDTDANYDAEMSKLLTLYDERASRRDILKQVDRLISSVKNPEKRTQLFIQRAAKSRTDFVKILCSTQAYYESKTHPKQVSRPTALAAKCVYARALNSAEWRSESLHILKEILADVKQKGLPVYGSGFSEDELLTSRSLAASILAETGQLNEARAVLPPMPAELNERTPWRELYNTEMTLNNVNDAERLLNKCYEVNDLYLMSLDTIEQHHEQLEEACIRNCKRLLSEHRNDPIRQLTLRATAATIRLDQGRTKEAQSILKPALAQLPELYKEQPDAARPLVTLADISGLDVNDLVYMLDLKI